MIHKRPYFRPLIETVELDVNISMQMTTRDTPPVGPDPTGAPATDSSFKETDDSGLNENPFKR